MIGGRMLRFGKATDYALLALMHLVESETGSASARQIAAAYHLPLPLLCKILKSLHCNGLLQSTRGSKGGYRIAVDLRDVSLEQLMRMLRRAGSEAQVAVSRPAGSPLAALHAKLREFVRDVKLSDLLIPGRRIDVPVESVGVRKSPRRELVSI
jgi:Rrf2 family protein